MDPNANLEEQRRLTELILSCGNWADANASDCTRLAELVQALDEWLCKGGFLPKAWTPRER
jgi:hypothetical protein